MKKIFFRMLPVVATGVVLTACNNAEEVKKQTDEQNAKIQTLVDEKLAGLQAGVDSSCTVYVDSLATAKYDEWVATSAPKKGATKPKKADTKKADPKVDVGQKGTENTKKVDVGQKSGNTKKIDLGQKP